MNNEDEILTRVEDIIEPMGSSEVESSVPEPMGSSESAADTFAELSSGEKDMPKSAPAYGKNKKKNKIFVICAIACTVIFIVLGLLILRPKKCKVTFLSDDGKEIMVTSVKSGQKLELIEAPEKKDYIFVCWMLGTKEYNSDSEISEDIILKAKYAKKCVITYLDTNGKVLKTQDAALGEIVKDPFTPPEIKNKAFVSWMNGEAEYNFKAPIKENVTLSPLYKDYIKSLGIAFDNDEYSVAMNEELQTKVIVIPANTTDKTTYKSSDTNIFTVDETGKIKGIKKGTASLSAYIGDCEPAVVTVNVIEVLPESVSFESGSEAAVFLGSTKEFKVLFTPENTTLKDITFSSSDINIASVDSKGVVTGVGRGHCTITAETKNGKKAEIKLSVIKRLEGLKITPEEITLKPGESVTLKAVLTPSDADITGFGWHILDVADSFKGYIAEQRDGEDTYTITVVQAPEKKVGIIVVCDVFGLLPDNNSNQLYTVYAEP